MPGHLGNPGLNTLAGHWSPSNPYQRWNGREVEVERWMVKETVLLEIQRVTARDGSSRHTDIQLRSIGESCGDGSINLLV